MEDPLLAWARIELDTIPNAQEVNKFYFTGGGVRNQKCVAVRNYKLLSKKLGLKIKSKKLGLKIRSKN